MRTRRPEVVIRQNDEAHGARPPEQGGQRWFRQYPDEKIEHTDELHWTRRSQNWNR